VNSELTDNGFASSGRRGNENAVASLKCGTGSYLESVKVEVVGLPESIKG
jgi:hypothetical protein